METWKDDLELSAYYEGYRDGIRMAVEDGRKNLEDAVRELAELQRLLAREHQVKRSHREDRGYL